MREFLPLRGLTIATSLLTVFLMLSPNGMVNGRADDISHENYSLVRSNLDVVVSLLRSTITYSEFALMAMYNESMGEVEQNLTVVRGLLTPADNLLGKIRDIADSYENLSRLLPPFSSLSSQMDSFSSMEVSLIGARGTVVSATKLAGLTGEDLLRTLDAINSFNSLVHQMNRTIDEMVVSAESITGLVVSGDYPFADNQLVPLIEKLRDLLYAMQYEVDIAIRQGIHWNETQPFSTLWLSASEYYLGEQIVGGGYLYYNGTFTSNHLVTILMDGRNLTSAVTSANGQYDFSYLIPVDASWLGPHNLQATSSTPTGQINTNVVPIRIILIPTHITLQLSSGLLSYDDSLVTSVALEEVHGLPVADGPCHLILDSTNVTFATNELGQFAQRMNARDLGFGTHYVQAFFDGELPYAPSASELLNFTINIPTTLNLRLFASRIPANLGYFVLGNGTLLANGTTPLSGQNVTISIDGVAVYNDTTNANGEFGFSIPSEDIPLGGHILVAEFLHRDIIWRYSMDQVGFTIYGLKQSGYPFFPLIPGWGGGMPESISYLFIGPYAYYFWLLTLLLLGTIIKLLQMRKHRTQLSNRLSSETLESLDEGLIPGPAPAELSAEGFAREISIKERGSTTPNERIIWYYQRLLSFLTRRENLKLRSSMTHWEVARTLKLIGYPTGIVDRITLLFEQAFYSGLDLTDTETVQMSTDLTRLIAVKRSGVPNAI